MGELVRTPPVPQLVRSAAQIRELRVPTAAAAATAGAEPRLVCEVCGGAACARVFHGCRAGVPVRHTYCLSCMRAVRESRAAAGPRISGQALALAVAGVGVAAGALALLTDLLVPVAVPGFGITQRLGLAVAALLLGFGILFRVVILSLPGLLLLLAVLAWDWLAATGTAGFGWKQQTLLLVAVVCVVSAVARLLAERLLRRGRSAAESRLT